MKLKANQIAIRVMPAAMLILLIISNGISVGASTSFFQSDSTKSIIIGNEDVTPLNRLRGDTLRVDTSSAFYGGIPGAIGAYTSSFQDSNYTKALRLKLMIPHSARLANDLRSFSKLIPSKSDKTTYQDQAENALNLPPEFYMPSKIDIANYQYGLMMSQNNVTGIRIYNPNGLKIPLSSIGMFLGLTEDVTPVIKYNLEYRTDVMVLVYSVNAVAIATIFDGFQLPGKYSFTWNGRDDYGRKMPKGDYVAEVRIGKERFVRKRIVIP
jgi:hypothetical protein